MVAVAAISIAVRFSAIRTEAEAEAAAITAQSLTPPLTGELDGFGRSSLDAFTEVAEGLLSDDVRAIRFWSSDGELLAAAGISRAALEDPQALARGVAGEGSALKTDGPEGTVLASYESLGSGAVLEVQQNYKPIADSIASSQRHLLLVIGIGSGAFLLLLPVILWITVRGLRSEYGRLLHLYRTGQAVRSTLELTDVLETLARDAAFYTRAQLSFTTLVEEGTNDLILKASFERDENTAAQHHRKVEEWFIRRCAATGETVADQLAAFPYASVLGYEPRLRGPVNILCVAIPGHDGALGIVVLTRRLSQSRFVASEVRMVEEMAAQAAMAVEQAVLFAKVRRYADEVELSYDSTLKVLMAALDTKDSVTQGHSERVSRLTVALAKEFDLPNELLVHMERGALLHDVGKIGVPDDVLQKPDSLNEREWEAMQKHPLLAGLMVSKVGFLEGALPILLYHHERFDGTGYPFGLQGKAIPLEARIFSVIDSYDAMTSDRPYRKAMPHDAAMAEIGRYSGIQFDPEIVEAFTRLMESRAVSAERAA